MAYISVVIPCYNESLSIPTLFQKAQYVTSNYDIEIIFLDNGSNDGTWNVMKNLKLNNKITMQGADSDVTMGSAGNSTSMADVGGDGEVSGLVDVFKTQLNLNDVFLQEATSWCVELGIRSVSEILDDE